MAAFASVLIAVPALARVPIPITAEGLQKFFDDPKQSGVTSVESFLNELPEEFRRNFIVMVDSGSTQKADPNNPRIILKSKDAKTLITFNTGPKLDGYNTVELIQFDEADRKFKFNEVQFGGKGKKPEVHGDPAKCKECHGKDLRPNWDAYNFWPGQLPFNRDELFKGTVEAKMYVDLARRSPKSARLSFLRFPDDLETRLETDGKYRIPHDDTADGPGVHMFDQLTALNGKKVARQLKESPGYDTWKYALAAVVGGCGKIENFLPEAVRMRNEAALGKNFGQLHTDTSKRQNKLRDDKEKRQRLIFRRMLMGYPSGLSGKALEDAVEAEMTARPDGRENKEEPTDAFIMTGLRYVLEPEGVEVGKFSMSLADGTTDQPTYTFADQVSLLRKPINGTVFGALAQELDAKIKDLQARIKTEKDGHVLAELKTELAEDQKDRASITAGNGCPLLKKRSLAAYAATAGATPGGVAAVQPTAGASPCPVPAQGVALPGGSAIVKVTRAAIKAYRFPSSCTGCHVGEKAIIDIPFDQPDELRKTLMVGVSQPPPKGKLKNSPFYQKLMTRIHSTDPLKVMPKPVGTGPNGEKLSFKPLTTDEMNELDTYLNYVFDPGTLEQYPE